MDGDSYPEMKNLPPVPSLHAFARLGMGDLDVRQIIEFLTRSRAEIHAIEAHLGAIYFKLTVILFVNGHCERSEAIFIEIASSRHGLRPRGPRNDVRPVNTSSLGYSQ